MIRYDSRIQKDTKIIKRLKNMRSHPGPSAQGSQNQEKGKEKIDPVVVQYDDETWFIWLRNLAINTVMGGETEFLRVLLDPNILLSDETRIARQLYDQAKAEWEANKPRLKITGKVLNEINNCMGGKKDPEEMCENIKLAFGDIKRKMMYEYTDGRDVHEEAIYNSSCYLFETSIKMSKEIISELNLDAPTYIISGEDIYYVFPAANKYFQILTDAVTMDQLRKVLNPTYLRRKLSENELQFIQSHIKLDEEKATHLVYRGLMLNLENSLKKFRNEIDPYINGITTLIRDFKKERRQINKNAKNALKEDEVLQEKYSSKIHAKIQELHRIVLAAYRTADEKDIRLKKRMNLQGEMVQLAIDEIRQHKKATIDKNLVAILLALPHTVTGNDAIERFSMAELTSGVTDPETNDTMLHLAVRHERYDIIDLLLSDSDFVCEFNEADSRNTLFTNNQGNTIVDEILVSGNYAAASLFIKHGVSLRSILSKTDKDGYTLLYHTIVNPDCRDIADHLIKIGADLNQAHPVTGDTLLHEATRADKQTVEIVEYLLSKYDYTSSLIEAAANNTLPKNKAGYTVIDEILRHICLDVAMIYASYGFSQALVNAKNKDDNDNTLLCYALEKEEFYHLAIHLILMDANLSEPNQAGITPLDIIKQKLVHYRPENQEGMVLVIVNQLSSSVKKASKENMSQFNSDVMTALQNEIKQLLGEERAMYWFSKWLPGNKGKIELRKAIEELKETIKPYFVAGTLLNNDMPSILDWKKRSQEKAQTLLERKNPRLYQELEGYYNHAQVVDNRDVSMRYAHGVFEWQQAETAKLKEERKEAKLMRKAAKAKLEEVNELERQVKERELNANKAFEEEKRKNQELLRKIAEYEKRDNKNNQDNQSTRHAHRHSMSSVERTSIHGGNKEEVKISRHASCMYTPPRSNQGGQGVVKASQVIKIKSNHSQANTSSFGMYTPHSKTERKVHGNSQGNKHKIDSRKNLNTNSRGGHNAK